MRRAQRAISGATLFSALAFALAGCSSSSTPPARKEIKIAAFKSPALVKGALPARYTCDGQDIAPPLEWGAVPVATKELVVFILGLHPIPATNKLSPTPSGYTISVEWALAGINPALHKLPAGEHAPGTHVGRNTHGKERYSVCPAKGKNEKYQFALYAVPTTVGIAPHFVGLKILSLIGNPESATEAAAGGAFVANYKRR